MAGASKQLRGKSTPSGPSGVVNSVSSDKPLSWVVSSSLGDGDRGNKAARSSESSMRDEGGSRSEERGKEVSERKRGAGTAAQAVVIVISSDEDGDRDEEECRVLESDPFLSPTLENEKSLSGTLEDSFQNEDIVIIGDNGQVACRDNPHPRHLCVRFPSSTTAHEACCSKCYCYVCDVLAPCKRWKGTRDRGHCNASDQDPKWKDMRRAH